MGWSEIEKECGCRLAVLARCLPFPLEPLHIEVVCIRDVLSCILVLSVENIQVASDSLVSVKAINGSAINNSYFGLIIVDCKNLLSFVYSISVVYNQGSSNTLAHNLARTVAFLPDYRIWGKSI